MLDERVPLANAWSITSVLVICGGIAACSLYGGKGSVVTIGLVVIAVLAALLFATMLLCRLKITEKHIHVGVFPYRTRVSINSVVMDSVEVLPDGEHPRLRWRKNGIGLPGMQLGWFTTSRGKPVFAATAGKKDRVLIPTLGEHNLVVSSRDPKRVVAALRAALATPDAAGVAEPLGAVDALVPPDALGPVESIDRRLP